MHIIFRNAALGASLLALVEAHPQVTATLTQTSLVTAGGSATSAATSSVSSVLSSSVLPPLSSSGTSLATVSSSATSESVIPTGTAVSNGTSGTIPAGNPPEPTNTYVMTGNLTKPLVGPYQPAGGVNVNNTPPVYQPFSDFDFQSLNLALNQEYIELDLFNEGLRRFSDKDFTDAGLTAEDRSLVQFMANQEIGHAELISNMLGPNAAQQCTYQYPFTDVRQFIDFCQKVTRWGESGVYGFITHLDSRAAANLLVQSISTEARQQMIMRQFEGLNPMNIWFEPAITQSMAWTLLSPYLKSCPSTNPVVAFQNFPTLYINNNPNGSDPAYGPAITHNRTALSHPGREVSFTYNKPGEKVGPDALYVTNTTATGPPKWCAWVSQLNTTYTPVYDVKENSLKTKQPEGYLFSPLNPLVNGTMFVMLTDTDLYVTPHNMSLLNKHIVAGPALYQAG
ncbi:hypothetical protein RUND412_007553 [Rhizina undulata]